MADPDQGQELQHQPVGRRRSCALALVAADAGPLPAKGVGSREAQPAHEVRQENFEEDDHIATGFEPGEPWCPVGRCNFALYWYHLSMVDEGPPCVGW